MKRILLVVISAISLPGCAIQTRSVQSASDYDLAYCAEQGFTAPQHELETRRRMGEANMIEVANGWQNGR